MIIPGLIAASRRLASSGGTGDPYWTNVVLRQTLDVDFNDQSSSAKTSSGASYSEIVAGGKFGNCASHGSFSGDRFFDPSPDWNMGAGDFTVEFWIYPYSDGNGGVDFGLYTRVAGGRSWVIFINNRFVSFNGSSDGATANLWSITSPSAFPSGAVWTHICAERAGGTVRIYVNGAMVVKATGVSGTLFNPTSTEKRLKWGCRAGTLSDNYFMDDTRITKGVARYNSDAGFALPTAAYPVG